MPLLPVKLREPYRLTKNNDSSYSIDVGGLNVPYPQYLRLKAVKEKITKLDQVVDLKLQKKRVQLLEMLHYHQ